MNSHNAESGLDELFRQALQPLVEARAPATVWPKVVHRLESTRPPRWHRWLSWIRGMGAQLYLPPSSNLPRCVGPHGRCQPSPFLGVMVTQVIDLRLAS